eukprot:5384000-Pleurochrysis_carterae.AAC.9
MATGGLTSAPRACSRSERSRLYFASSPQRKMSRWPRLASIYNHNSGMSERNEAKFFGNGLQTPTQTSQALKTVMVEYCIKKIADSLSLVENPGSTKQARTVAPPQTPEVVARSAQMSAHMHQPMSNKSAQFFVLRHLNRVCEDSRAIRRSASPLATCHDS